MQLPDGYAATWFKPGRERTRVVSLSRVNWWKGHFDLTCGRKVRCQDLSCKFCNEGMAPNLFFVLGVRHPEFGRLLFELRERHRSIVEALARHELEGVGAVLDVWRKSDASNSPVEVQIQRFIEVDQWEISPLVDAIGLTHQKKSGDSRSADTTAQEVNDEAIRIS